MRIKESHLKELIKEAAAEYVWGVKSPGRVANQYSISTLNLKKLVCEEISKILSEQAGGAPASHVPDVSPAGAGAGMTRADMREISKIERKTRDWGDTQADIVEMAYELGVDPQLVGDFDNIMMSILQAMVDMAMQQYQNERPMPA